MNLIDSLRSSLRPVITYAFAAAMIAGFFYQLIPPEVFYTVAGNVISFWFGQRSGEKRGDSET